MILTQLTGGLGNQLFQWQAALILALRNKSDVFLDVSKVIQSNKDPGILAYHIPGSFKHVNMRVIHAVDELDFRVSKLTCLVENDRELKPSEIIINSVGQNFRLQGFFQSSLLSDELRLLNFDFKGLQIRKKNLINSQKFTSIDSETVVIHIRRGDYAHAAELWGLLGEKYYLNALDSLSIPLGTPACIFSDDPLWVKHNFVNLTKRLDARFMSFKKNRAARTLQFMSTGSKFVLGNSTFSWWAGYLSRSNQVVAPSQFYRGAFNNLERYPKSWRLVDSVWM